ncbi:MAG: DNA replication complex GINS family protein [Candidatus Aenigmarchaeota archaeon]|nr:DNA replication complex GINS family protein [Candidatus Aenigmarchaeota archaeon]
MLTYETLRRMMTDEKNSKKLLNLPENFFDEAKAYLENKAKFADTKEDAWELDSARRVLQDLLEIREGKLLTIALYNIRSGETPGSITKEEKEFFDNIVNRIKEFQERRREMFEGKKEKMQAVAFLEALPQFVGADMKNYGPFERGDMATIPEANAKLLVERGIVKQINPNK